MILSQCGSIYHLYFFAIFSSSIFWGALFRIAERVHPKGVEGMKFTAEQLQELIKKDRTDIFYNSQEWRKLAKTVKSENHNECYMCNRYGRYSKATMVHHVKHLKTHPELAYSKTYIDDNGNECIQLMPLCYWCHEAMHNREWHKAKKERYKNEEKW